MEKGLIVECWIYWLYSELSFNIAHVPINRYPGWPLSFPSRPPRHSPANPGYLARHRVSRILPATAMSGQDSSVRETRSLSASRAQSSRDSADSLPESGKTFEDFVRLALAGLGSKIDKLLTGQTALETQFSNLETKVKSNTSEIQKIIESVEFDSASIKDQSAQIHELNIKLENRDAELQHANYAIASMQSEINALERYTRGFKVRVMGIPEEEGEDCVTRVSRMLHDHFGISDPAIENAHRVGKARDGKTRQVIARFHSRAIRVDRRI